MTFSGQDMAYFTLLLTFSGHRYGIFLVHMHIYIYESDRPNFYRHPPQSSIEALHTGTPHQLNCWI